MAETGPEQLSKHKRRRARREAYFQMIDAETAHERHFMGRVVHTLNTDGIDTAPDGRPIKANWWAYIDSRDKRDRNAALACHYLVDRAITSIRPART